MSKTYHIHNIPRYKLPWLVSSTLHLAPAWAGCFKRAGLGTVREIMTTPLGRVISADRKHEKNDVLLLELEQAGEGTRFFIKRYHNFKYSKIWRRAFRGNYFPPSLVCKEYRNVKRLERWGFDVPKMMGYGEERYAGGVIMAVLVSEEIPDVIGLDLLVKEWLPAQPPAPRREARLQLLNSLADITRRMHEHGFEHHDYYLRNLMVSTSDLDRIYILDCPRGWRWPRFMMPWRSQHDLATLDAASGAFCSRTDRMRFFLRYRQHRRLTARDKVVLRKILKRADPMRKRQEKRLGEVIRLEEIPKPDISSRPNLEELPDLMLHPDSCHAANQEHPRI